MGDTAFTKEQFDTIYPEGIRNHYWNHARNRIITRFMENHKLKKDKILEIGCGKGVVVGFLRTKGFNCLGVELGEVDPFSGLKNYIFAKTDAFELPLDLRQSMDTVLLLDVIEHLEDPAAFIHEISMKFDNIRHLVITAPARQELWTNYDAYNGHFRRYNLAKVKSLCTSEIHLADAGYFNHLLYPVFWIFARFIKNRETVIKAPSGIGIVVHRILSFILRMDYSLFPAHLPGTSVIALFSFRK